VFLLYKQFGSKLYLLPCIASLTDSLNNIKEISFYLFNKKRTNLQKLFYIYPAFFLSNGSRQTGKPKRKDMYKYKKEKGRK
jgi:hypothetical protein